MTPESVSAAITQAVTTLAQSGTIDLSEIPDARVDRPKNREHGDYASNAAMVLAGQVGMRPRVLAELIAEQLRSTAGIEAADVAGPGFINVKVSAAAAGMLVTTVLRDGTGYGRSDQLSGTRIDVEFISANPTGPIHLGHARWAAVGDALARVLAAAGADVTTEYYINDRGTQMDMFGESLVAAAAGEPIPADGYHGAYIVDLARDIVAEHPEFTDLTGRDRMIAFREAGYERQLRQQQESLHDFRTDIEVWASERELHRSGAVGRAFARFDELGNKYDSEGATWLRTTDHGDDKDRVLVKADGEMTYFASDTAYYADKRSRGFDICLYLLGADHHGYVDRLKAVAACSGDDPAYNIEVPIGQMVTMTRSGKEVRLSKRAGNIVTITDLVEEVGVDAARYSLIRYPVDSPLTLDLDLLVKRTNENPVFYVQYAHARISSVLRKAGTAGIGWQEQPLSPELLSHERESILLGLLAEFPRVVRSAAELREPHRIPRYLETVANGYHRFYDSCRVLPRGDDEVDDTNIARLQLCAATRQVLANGLDLCGVSAPERM